MVTLNNYTVKINASKMRSARLARGLDKTDLSKLMELSVTSISNYENGKTDISRENLDKYSKILDFPINFFTSDYSYKLDISKSSPIFFRSSRITNGIRDMYEQKYEHLMLVHKTLLEYLDFPEVNIRINTIDTPRKGFGYTSEEIESLALELRRSWELGEGPIDNLLETIIENGIIVSKVKTSLKATTDGFSKILENTPIIFLNKDRGTVVRDRFSLAHELGHIILHADVKDVDMKNRDVFNQVELEANRFASSFLLPANSFSEDILTVDINSLIPLKEKWKVSLKGMVMRLKELNIINQRQQTNSFIYISTKKWNIKEPLDDTIEKEEFNLYQEAFETLFEEEQINPNNIIEKIGIGKDRIQEVCDLTHDFFDPYITLRNSKPMLRLIK